MTEPRPNLSTNDLIAWLARLSDDERLAVVRMISPPKRRGGDRRAGSRRELHEGVRAMASMLGLDRGKPVSKVAREILHRCNRYRPMPVETDPLRQAMQRVKNAGAPMPQSERQIARIISSVTFSE